MSVERIREKAGNVAVALLAVVLCVIAGRLMWERRWLPALFVVLPLLTVMVRNPDFRHSGDWRSELPPPSMAFRAAVAALFWVGIGCFLAFPGALTGGPSQQAPSELAQAAILFVCALPAAAILHLVFRAKLPIERKAELSWGIQRLGPLSAAVYLFNRGALVTGRRTMHIWTPPTMGE